MTITITGGKYTAAAVASVGTTSVAVTTTPFVSGDFAVQRRVDLFTSANVFKGMAFVRSWTNTATLQLETQFFDPKTGATVSQVVGDLVLVSKNWADVAQAGIAVSGNLITVSDTITFGTSGQPQSLAFHDESVTVVNTVATSRPEMWNIAGGFVSFGHLQNWASKTWYGGCAIITTAGTYNNSFVATSTSARLCMWGGSHGGTGASPCYFAAGANPSNYGTDWALLWALDVKFDGTDVTCKGGNVWTVPANHILENCSFAGAGSNQILLSFGNGTVLGGQFKVLRNSGNPIAVFAADIVGTFTRGADPGKRAVILDVGTNAFWWNYYNYAQTVNCTNIISSDFRAGQTFSPENSAAANTTVNISYSDNYTNLQDTSGLAAIRDSDWSVESSATASGVASTVALTVLRSTGTGHTQGSARGPWTYRVRKYGFDEIEGAITETSYSLGTAGTAFNVSFGGYVNQIARASLTDPVATALAYTGITVTDHGASPVTWNSKSWSISVVVDLATYPTRTAAQVFAHIKAKIAATASWGGKVGLLWHVLMEESGGAYISQRGKSGGAGATLKGVRIIDQAGTPLTGLATMTADDGTIYTVPTSNVRGLSFSGLIAGSTLRIFDAGTTTEVFATTSSGTGESWSETATGSRTLDYTIFKDGYLPIRVTGVVVTGATSGGVLSNTIQPVVDRAYETSTGLTVGSNIFIIYGTKRLGLTSASTLQNVYSLLVEAWRTETSLRNKAFTLQANGPNSFTLLDGWEFDLTGYPNSIANLRRDGLRYLSSAGATTAVWAAFLSVGVPAWMTVRYQQTDGGTTQSAAATGNIDQLVKIYGDTSHGSISYAGYGVFKVQGDGYDQAEQDAIATYGTLEDQLYVVGLAPTPNGIGAATVTGISITDHGASPVTWNSKVFSITITDSGVHSGQQILQYVRGLNNFNLHDLVRSNGSKFKTVNGNLYGDTGAALKGVRVLRGSSAHPDFDLYTADDGTTYAPVIPVQVVAAVLPNTRVRLVNVTTSTEIDNVFVTGSAYSYTVTTEATNGDVISVQACKMGYIEASSTGLFSSVSGFSALLNQSVDPVYSAWGIDGSTVTEFTLDVTGVIEIDSNDADGSTTKARLGAWYSYVLTTANGIRYLFGAITLVSAAAIRINTDVLDLQIENINSSMALRFTDLNVRLYRSDGTSVIAPTSYSIHNDYSGVPDVVETGVSGLTGSESAQLMGLPNTTAIESAVWSATTRTLTSGGGGTAPSAEDNAVAVWSAISRTLTSATPPSASAIESAVWSGASRTLTSAAPPTASAVSGAVMADLAIAGVDVRKINGVALQGAGAAGNEWRPV